MSPEMRPTKSFLVEPQIVQLQAELEHVLPLKDVGPQIDSFRDLCLEFVLKRISEDKCELDLCESVNLLAPDHGSIRK